MTVGSGNSSRRKCLVRKGVALRSLLTLTKMRMTTMLNKIRTSQMSFSTSVRNRLFSRLVVKLTITWSSSLISTAKLSNCPLTTLWTQSSTLRRQMIHLMISKLHMLSYSSHSVYQESPPTKKRTKAWQSELS